MTFKLTKLPTRRTMLTIGAVGGIIILMNEFGENIKTKIDTILSQDKIEISNPNSLTLKKGKYYLVEVNGIKALISLKNFNKNPYLNGQDAPGMEIDSEYENKKFFEILDTFVLPTGKGNFGDMGEDGSRCVKQLPFCYKLNSYNKNNGTMNLSLNSKYKGTFKITEQPDISKFSLKTRAELSTEEIISIYGEIDSKLQEQQN